MLEKLFTHICLCHLAVIDNCHRAATPCGWEGCEGPRWYSKQWLTDLLRSADLMQAYFECSFSALCPAKPVADWLSSVACSPLAGIGLNPLNFQRKRRILPIFLRKRLLFFSNISRNEGHRKMQFSPLDFSSQGLYRVTMGLTSLCHASQTLVVYPSTDSRPQYKSDDHAAYSYTPVSSMTLFDLLVSRRYSYRIYAIQHKSLPVPSTGGFSTSTWRGSEGPVVHEGGRSPEKYAGHSVCNF